MYSFNYEENLIGHSFLFCGSPPFFNKSWLCFFSHIFVILCAFFCRKLQICFIHQTKKIVSPEKIRIFIDNQLGRRSTAKIKRGLGTERSRLARSVPKPLKVPSLTLGTLNQNFEFFTKKSTHLFKGFLLKFWTKIQKSS